MQPSPWLAEVSRPSPVHVAAFLIASTVLLLAAGWLLYDPGHYHIECTPDDLRKPSPEYTCVTTAVRNYGRLAEAVAIAVVGVSMGVIVARRPPVQGVSRAGGRGRRAGSSP